MTERAKQIKENCRIEDARIAFIKIKRFLYNRGLNLNLRTRILYIFSIFLYGVEAWTIKPKNLRNIEAFEIIF